MKRDASVNRAIPQPPAHLDEQHLDLLGRPAQPAGQRAHGHGLQAAREDVADEAADVLLGAVAGPGAQGHAAGRLINVLEASGLGAGGVGFGRAHVDVHGAEAVVDEVHEEGGGPVGGHGAIVGEEGPVEVLNFEPAAGREGAVR